jgi:hypothetical protein
MIEATFCPVCNGFTAVPEGYEGPAKQRCTCNSPESPTGEFLLCDRCNGYKGAVPGDYEGPAIHQCYCDREDHLREEAFRAGQDGSGEMLGVNVSESVNIKDKMGG